MKKIFLGIAIMLFMVLGSFFLVSGNSSTQNQGNGGGIKPLDSSDGELRGLYDNDKMFEELSGAARSVLEQRFGRKEDSKRTTIAAPVGTPLAAASGVEPVANPNTTLATPIYSTGLRGSIRPLGAVNNVLANNPQLDLTAQDTQSETSIAIGRNGNVIVGWNDSGSFTGSNAHFTGFGVSTNGGSSFVDKGILPEDPTGEGDAGDPIIGVDQTTGRVYFVTLGFQTLGKLQVFRSDDNGQTFQAPVNGTPGSAGQQDKEWVAVDNFAGTGQGNVYLGWRNFGSTNDMRFTRSTDGGNTFGGNLSIAAGGQGAFVTVGPDHSVYYFWYNSSTAPRRITMRKSTDFGVTFGPTITVANLIGTGTNGDLALTGGFRSNSFPQVGVNPVSGHLYCVFNDASATTGGDRGNIFLARSTDGGATWGTPTRVNDDTSATAQQYQPVIAVRPDGSGLFVGFYDRRRDPANQLIDVYGAIASIDSISGAVTFNPNFRITTASFPVVVGVDPVINTTYMGDYDQAIADSNFYYYSWSDNRDRNLANTRNNANVRVAAIPVAGPGALLDFSTAAINFDGNTNGIIDTNECVGLDITISNTGTSAATGVTATLSTMTPGVTVSQAMSNYPNVPAGGTAVNTTPFQITIDPSFACGTKVDLTLTVNTASDGMFTLPFSLNTGALGSTPTPFESVNVPVNILDVATVTSVTNVSGFTSSIGKVTVSFFLTHTFDADLDIFLIGPDGTTVELTTDNGGAGDNFGTSCAARTVFDDAAATAITAGVAPFAGTFRPEGMLAAFNGKSGAAVNGNWTLRITDDLGGDVGILMCWGLQITPQVCIDGGGPCANAPACPVEHTTIYASDTNNSRIQRSTNDGSSWQSVGFGPGTTLGKFNAPRGVASDTSDTLIFVADTGNNRIQRSSDGGITW
ncbi:MAG: proprotein convertase P-domain-containing protein, partial [Acidobacteriota bacterium]